jgi:ubiquinone biosynthesis protein
VTPAPDLPPALRALTDAAAMLVRRSATGRVLLARVADLVPADALPASMHDAREAANGRLEPQEVERVLRDAWGRAPAEVLDDLDPEPLAVRPAAQVHRGILEGAPVAVKVRRPGLTAAVRTDLALLDVLGAPLRLALPALDVAAVLGEIREAALDELDLEYEASTQRLARRALRRVTGVVVPAVHGDLAHEDVLVTDLLEGPTLAQARPEDPALVARCLLRAHVAAARAGLALTDPRPGHVILLPHGEVGLLGTGVARAVPRERATGGLAVLAALRAGDEDAAAAAVTALGLAPEATARAAFPLVRDVLGDLVTGPARLDHATLRGVGRRGGRRLPEILAIAGAGTPGAADVALGRLLGQLTVLLAHVGATEDWAVLASDSHA